MSPEKLRQALLARAQRKQNVQTERLRKIRKNPLSLLEKVFCKLATPVFNKYNRLLSKYSNPQNYATVELLSQFNQAITRLEKQLEKGKAPNRRFVSSLLSSVPVIASVPLAYPEHKRSVDSSLAKLSEASKKMDPETGAILQGLLCVISLVSDPVALEEKE